MNPPRRFLRSVRLLAQCYQGFERLSGRHVRALGLTPAQFDIVATLGNTEGMSFRALGEQTLITKGTLTGVVDRLEMRGVIERRASRTDGRSTVVALTDAGRRLFEKVFPEHVAYCARAFSGWREDDFARLDAELARLRETLAPAALRARPA